jgi:toxin YoeB
MAFHLDFTDQAKRDIEWHKKSGNKAVLNKLFILLNELMENPFEGTGKPEPLKHQLSGCWSRIINLEHRLIYSVGASTVFILSVRGHY